MAASGATIRRWFVRAPLSQRIDLRGKQMLVTGAAQGSIGFETARILAMWGADVVITTRSHPELLAQQLRERIAGAPGHGNIDAHSLDLADAHSVERFAAWHADKHGERLDVLINNAGIHLDLLSQWRVPRLTADGHEIHWRTNYLGPMHLTQRLLPLLQGTGQRHGDARIVTVVSKLHAKGSNDRLFAPSQPYNSWVAYGNSKLALVHASFEIQRRYAATDNLQAYCLHPGAVFTHIADRGLSGNPLLERIRKALAPIEAFFLLTPEEGAQTSVHCATAPGLAGGRYYQACAVQDSSRDSHDAQFSARLWANTADWLNAPKASS